MTHLTRDGADQLREELRLLIEHKRPALVNQLAKGRSEGKLRENADFDDARERLWIVDAQIRRIEDSLSGVTYLENREQDEVDAVREELRHLKKVRLPKLVKGNSELSARISSLNVESLRKRLQEQKDQTKEKIDRTEKRIKERKAVLSRENSKERQGYLKKALLKLEKSDLPRLHSERKNINRKQTALNELKKEHDRSRALIVNVQARIKHLGDRLNTVITRETETQLQYELCYLIEQRRPELAQKLTEAVAQGDLKENADYHDAKEQLGFTEGRVKEIEAILRIAIVVDNSQPSDEVRIGSTVVIQEDGEDFDEEYRIVGSAEANPRERKISEKSPIGSALLGKRIGKKVKVETPDGVIKFKIVDIR